MAQTPLEKKLTLQLLLATSFLAALLLFASQIVFWPISLHAPALKAVASPSHLQSYLNCCVILLLLMFFLTVRYLLIKSTKPLFALIAHAESLHTKTGSDRLFPASDSPEISSLGSSFNNLISQLDMQRKETEKLKVRYRAMTESDVSRQACIDQLRLQNDYLQSLHETALGLSGIHDLQSLLSAIIDRATNLMHTQHGFIFLLNDAKTEMEIRVTRGYFETFEHHPLKRGEDIAGHVWEQATVCVTPDYHQWSNGTYHSHHNTLKATIGVPLTSDGDVIGVIGLSSAVDNEHFDDIKIKMMQQFAELASLALDNARLYDSAKKEFIEHTRVDEQFRKLSLAVMQSPLSIIITDSQGNIEFANPYAVQLSGYNSEELMGKNPRIFKSDLTSRAKYKTLWDTILAGGEWRGELQNRKKNGQLYWERVFISPVRDNNGVITHFITIKEDISDFKIMENQLRHTQKLESIGQLASGIAHDFNNILTAIIGYGNLLLMKSPSQDPARSTAEQILAAAERGASITQKLLTFTRNQASNPVKIDLNAVILHVEKILHSLIGDNSNLVVKLSKQAVSVMADSVQMEQVLINLATNVRDAMPGGCTMTISTERVVLDTEFTSSHGIGPKGCYALLTVSDTGHGMDDDTIKRIFEPFYSTKETGKGTGLGLSIVYGIIKKHNGHIICKSKPDKGTVFYIYLPLEEEFTSISSPIPTALPDTSMRNTILLGNSDKESNSYTKRFLEEFGYSVIEAEDSGMVLEVYKKYCNSICLVILDGIISGCKGIKTFREIKSIVPVTRILLCGDPHDSTTKQLQSLFSSVHFISKPFPPKELLMKVREVVKDAP
ncbi:MAG: PAS domain-containing protein [Desulfuromonadales bacterium]|nr:PAS domain-containing protein [Desulfuromonadales bacterium]